LKLFCKFGSGSIWTDSRFNRRPTTHRQPPLANIMKYNLLTIIYIFLFVPIFGQNSKLISELSIDTSRLYSHFNEINSFDNYSLYASVYIGEFERIQFGATIIDNEKNYIVIFQTLKQPNFKIIDLLVIEKENNCYLQSYNCSCSEDIDHEIIGLARITKDEFTTQEFHENIIKAWRLNKKLKKITPIDSSGIKCYNDGFGV